MHFRKGKLRSPSISYICSINCLTTCRCEKSRLDFLQVDNLCDHLPISMCRIAVDVLPPKNNPSPVPCFLTRRSLTPAEWHRCGRASFSTGFGFPSSVNANVAIVIYIQTPRTNPAPPFKSATAKQIQLYYEILRINSRILSVSYYMCLLHLSQSPTQTRPGNQKHDSKGHLCQKKCILGRFGKQSHWSCCQAEGDLTNCTDS